MGANPPLVRIRRFSDLTDVDLRAWRRLVAFAAEPNPFYEPALLLPAVRHLSDQDVRLLTVEDPAGWLATVPVVRQRWMRPFPGPCLVGWVHDHCYLGTPLVAVGRHDEVARAVLAEAEREPGVRWLALRELPEDGLVAEALRRAAATIRREPIMLDRVQRAVRSGADAPVGSDRLSSRVRSELRRRARRLAEELGATVETETASAMDPEVADRFLALEHTGWKAQAGTSLLSSDGGGAFFRAAAVALRSRMRFFCLEANGRDAAIASSITAGNCEFLFKIAYDERLGRHAPGLQVAVATIDELAAGGTRYVDSCAAPDNEVVNGLLPDRRSIVAIAIPCAGLLGRAYAPTLEMVASARRFRRERAASAQ